MPGERGYRIEEFTARLKENISGNDIYTILGNSMKQALKGYQINIKRTGKGYIADDDGKPKAVDGIKGSLWADIEKSGKAFGEVFGITFWADVDLGKEYDEIKIKIRLSDRSPYHRPLPDSKIYKKDLDKLMEQLYKNLQ